MRAHGMWTEQPAFPVQGLLGPKQWPEAVFLSGPGVDEPEPFLLSLVVLFLAPFLHCFLT